MALKIGEFEELVLLAIVGLGGEAFGADILVELEDKAERRCSMGALFTTLDRMAEKGYITSHLIEGISESGRKRRLLKVESLGKVALWEAERRRSQLRGPVPI